MNTAGLTALGMDFGLGVEPERVSPKSRLYAEHPARAYHLRIVHTGDVYLIGSPADAACAVQDTTPDRVVVLAWRTGLPSRTDRTPLRELTGDYTVDGVRYSGAHLCGRGLPIAWQPDAAVVVLERA